MDFVATWPIPTKGERSDPAKIDVQILNTPGPGDATLSVGQPGGGAWVRWDATGLHVARDGIGRFPLVWHLDASALTVASDPTLLPPAAIHWPRWSRWLEGTDDPGTDDFFVGVRRVLPGQILHWANPAEPPEVYRPPFLKGDHTDPLLLAEHLHPVLETTCHNLSRPVLFLSDGLDSSLVASFLGRYGHRRAATMVSDFADVTRPELVAATAKHCAIDVLSVHIDRWKPFQGEGPWLKNTQYGPILYPGLAYELPFARAALERSGADCIVSGVGADQLFDRSVFQLYHWGFAHRDMAAVEAALRYFFPRELLAMELSKLPFYRRMRLPRPQRWADRGAYLRAPTYEVHSPFILDSWEWEGAVRSLRVVENSVGVPVVLPLANQAVLEAVRRFSHATHFSTQAKPVLREVARGRLPSAVIEAPKTTSFTAIFDDALDSLSQETIQQKLWSLEPILDIDAAVQTFRSEDSTVRRARYLLAGEVASGCGFR